MNLTIDGKTVHLTTKEADAMRLFHLGGPGAWRTETAHVACKTISALVRKRFFVPRSDWATELVAVVALACANASHAGSKS